MIGQLRRVWPSLPVAELPRKRFLDDSRGLAAAFDALRGLTAPRTRPVGDTNT